MSNNRGIQANYYGDPHPKKKAIKKYHHYGEGFWEHHKNSYLLVSRLFDKKEEAKHYLNIIHAVEDERNRGGFLVVNSIRTPGKFRVVANLKKISTTFTKESIAPIQNWIVNYLNQFALPTKIYDEYFLKGNDDYIKACAKHKWHISPNGEIACESVSVYFTEYNKPAGKGIYHKVQDFFHTTMVNLSPSKKEILTQNRDADFIFFKDNSIMYAQWYAIARAKAIFPVTASALQTGEHTQHLPSELLYGIAFFVPSKNINNIALVNKAAAETYKDKVNHFGKKK